MSTADPQSLVQRGLDVGMSWVVSTRLFQPGGPEMPCLGILPPMVRLAAPHGPEACSLGPNRSTGCIHSRAGHQRVLLRMLSLSARRACLEREAPAEHQ